MSGKQRYRLHREKIRATAKQQRTYSPIEFKGLTTITAQDGVTVTVPMEQLKFKDIPDDFKTGADLAKWLGAMGLAGYAIHSAAGDTASVTNNNSTGGTP
ncbi:MAG: hypothetical protein WCU80_08425 [Paludibacteraceae bacterium]